MSSNGQTVDSLNIEINADISKAQKAIASFSRSLATLSKNLSSFANNPDAKRGIRQINMSIQALSNTINGVDASKLSEVANAMKEINKQASKNGSASIKSVQQSIDSAKPNTADKGTLPNSSTSPTDDSGKTKEATKRFIELGKSISDVNISSKGTNGTMRSLGKGLSLVGKLASKISFSMFRFGKSVDNSNFSFKKGLKTILRYGFGIRSLYVAVNKLRSAFNTGSDNLAHYSSAYNKSLSAMKSATTSFKNALAVAFQPLVTVAIPYIVSFIRVISQALNMVNQFFSALMGKRTTTQANLDYWEDYGNAVGGASDAVKKLKGQLQGFDKLNNLTEDSGSGSGGGSATPNYEDMFTESEINANVTNFVDMLKKAWEDNGFIGLGETLRDLIINQLNGINWTEAQNRAREFGANFANFLVGLLNPDSLGRTLGGSIGTAVAGAINTAIAGFSGWIDAFSQGNGWQNLGTNLAQFVGNAIDDIKWDEVVDIAGKIGKGVAKTINSFVSDDSAPVEKIAKATAKLIKAGINVWYNFVTTLDFPKLGEKIGDGINKFFEEMSAVDASGKNGWQKLGATISSTIGGIAETITVALNKADFVQVGQAIVDLICAVDWMKLTWDLADLADAVGRKIAEALAGLVIDLVTVKFRLLGVDDESLTQFKEDFTEDFKNAFENWSPLAILKRSFDPNEWNQLGDDSGQGFLNGLKQKFTNIGNILYDIFVQPIKDLLGIHSPSTVFAEIGGYCIDGLVNGFRNSIENIKTFFTELPSKVLEWVDTITINLNVDSIKEKVQEKWNSAKEWLSEKKLSISATVDNLKNKVKEKWDALTTYWSDKKLSISASVSDFLTKVKEKWEKVKTWWSNKGKLSKPEATAPNFLTKVKEAWDKVKTWARTHFKLNFHVEYQTTGLNVLQQGIVRAFGLSGWPTLKFFKNGGFPNIGDFFMANENGVPELVGTMGGRPAVASGTEITGISDAIYNTSEEEIVLLRQQNQLLSQLLAKDYGISASDVFDSVRRSDRDYSRMNGHSAFAY